MTALVEAYQRSAIRDFERTLAANRASIMGDPFIAQYLQELLANIRTQARAWWLGVCASVWGGGGGLCLQELLANFCTQALGAGQGGGGILFVHLLAPMLASC